MLLYYFYFYTEVFNMNDTSLPEDIGETFMFQEQFGTEMEVMDGTKLIMPIRSVEESKIGYIGDRKHDKEYRESLKTIPIDDEWKEFIKAKDWYHATKGKLPTNLEVIRDKLLAFAGEEVCLFQGEDVDTLNILHCGQFWFGKDATIKQMENSRCHDNSLELWGEDRRMLSWNIHLCTGFALSDDGMWRRHSWCIRKDNRTIIETTTPRILYYGYVLRDVQVYNWVEWDD